MLSQAVLRRLGEINRQQAQAVDGPALLRSAKTPDASLDATTNVRIDTASLSQAKTLRRPFSYELPSGVETCNEWGSHYRITQSVSHLWNAAPSYLERTRAKVEQVAAGEQEAHADMRRFAESFPQRSMFLDLETCGFAGSMIFLIGLLIEEQGELTLVQLLARNYAEEKAILKSLWDIAARHDVLVTFNGKSFDWPVVHDRSTRYHLGEDPRHVAPPAECESIVRQTAKPIEVVDRNSPRPHLAHCDLLHHCRRRWKKKLPNCKLQTLEHLVCGRKRSGDIPGRDIPAAYHEFVRSGDAWQMRAVLHHNALDLVTLMQLSLRVLQ